MSKKSARQRAIVRRRIFLCFCAAVLAALIVIIIFTVKALTAPKTNETDTPSKDNVSSVSSSQPESSAPEDEVGPHGLDVNYSNLMLVNGDNPLPEDYDYTKNFTTIPNEYLNNSWFQQIGGQIDKDVWPYMKAMLDDARAEGVQLAVWSPYRSYDTQRSLFNNQVERCKSANSSLSQEAAEREAATVVARPGTSEHHTGLAADFNMADDKFEQTQMFAWLQKHAADYGFIMRYSAEKQSKTGVIHESWHYRFVGIKAAKEINSLDMCLEEYLEYKK